MVAPLPQIVRDALCDARTLDLIANDRKVYPLRLWKARQQGQTAAHLCLGFLDEGDAAWYAKHAAHNAFLAVPRLRFPDLVCHGCGTSFDYPPAYLIDTLSMRRVPFCSVQCRDDYEEKVGMQHAEEMQK